MRALGLIILREALDLAMVMPHNETTTNKRAKKHNVLDQCHINVSCPNELNMLQGELFIFVTFRRKVC